MYDKDSELAISQQLVDHLPYEVMWLNEAGELVYANNMFFKKMGYKRTDVPGLTIFDINPTTDAKSWKRHWSAVKKKGIVDFKDTHKTRNGKLYEVEVFAQFFSNNGKARISAIINEITESSFYRNLLGHAERLTRVGGWKLNLQDGSIIVTGEAMQIFSTQEKEQFLPGNIIHQFKDPGRLKELLSGVIRNAHSFDEVLETDETPARFIRARAQAVLKGKKIFKIIGAYQDITDQQVRENELRLYKEIIDNTEDLVYVYHRSGDLLHYNKAVPEKLGYTPSELGAATIFDLDPSVTPQWWESHMDEIALRKILRFERTLFRKDGTKFQADITANYLKYQGSDLNCAIVRDITDHKRRETELYNALNEIAALKDQLEQENEYLKTEIQRSSNFDNIICTSERYAEVLRQVEKVAKTEATVLITGESGTGKELLADSIHQNSLRSERPLIKVNAATLPGELIESELFGHRKGAFTGAVADKVGKFALAHGGTLFLDEIGELPLELQPKLLRVLQEGEFDPLGSTEPIRVDVRIIAATNRDLEAMVRKGEFREDLYYRLNVFPIHNIPLRERKEDIPLLAQFFLEKYAAKAGKSFRKLSKKTIDALMRYSFPGNIRELENLIERAVILEEGTTLFPGDWVPKDGGPVKTGASFKSFEQAQKDYIIEVLRHTGGKVSGPGGAAEVLLMKDKTLYAKMKRLGIEKKTIYRG